VPEGIKAPQRLGSVLAEEGLPPVPWVVAEASARSAEILAVARTEAGIGALARWRSAIGAMADVAVIGGSAEVGLRLAWGPPGGRTVAIVGRQAVRVLCAAFGQIFRGSAIVRSLRTARSVGAITL
jgi:hypothetical protein